MEDNNLKVFYSCLVLVCALRPPKPDHIRTAQPDAAWCRFLNDLCWFCDTATGGKTVVSITTQHLRNSSRFWLACNSDTTGPLKSLKWLLSKLNNAHLLSESQLNHLETEIISESVRISHKKLKYHARRLQFCLEQVADARGNENG
nr:hypothetical protein CFP56_77665 [Quercus suber]